MTPQQLKILDCVRDMRAAGISPTIREIARQVGLSGPSNAHTLVGRLVDSGHLTRRAGRTRSIEIAGAPDLRLADTAAMLAELGRRGKSLDALRDGGRVNMGRHAVTCAAHRCHIEVRRGHLFCREHWFALPSALRARILDAFGAKDTAAYERAVTEARS